jgi:hypothetical protein
MDMSDRYRLRDDNSLVMEKSCIALFIERLDIVLSDFCPDISAHGLISLWFFRCLRMGKIDGITYKYVINYNNTYRRKKMAYV